MMTVMGSNFSHTTRIHIAGLTAVLLAAGAAYPAGAQDVVPLPSEVFGSRTPGDNPIIDLEGRMIDASGAPLTPEMPDTMTIDNHGGEVVYDSDKRTLTYKGKGKAVKLLTDAGLDIAAHEIVVELATKQARLIGPLTVYQGESLTRAKSGVYNWETEKLDVYDAHSKVAGVLVKGTHVEYDKDAEGKTFARINNAYVSTDDAEKPDTWMGAGALTVYPGDYAKVTRLSVSSGEYDVPVPILGWFSFSHSLNPKEGYLPIFGSRGIWGTYLCNSYGFLLGNRRVENNIPVADYILTTHVDYRTRRGLALGVDFEDVAMQKRYPNMEGLQTYFIYDDDPMVNPTYTKRTKTDRERYRVALSAMWELPSPGNDTEAKWTTTANLNFLSDKYVLRDFYEKESSDNDKPDNTLRLVRTDKRSQSMLLARFAPNDFYATDQRLEASYYRARTAIGDTGITYETRNSAGLMRQYVPVTERFAYREALDQIADADLRRYYARLLNDHTYFRINSTHEIAKHYKILGFLNVTPKAGVGYTGYYGVDEVGSDNRFLGYIGLDANIKLHRKYDSFNIPSLGYKGLTHIIKPYTTLSHCSISSSNQNVPQVDAWYKNIGTTSNNPMELDLMGFSGIDSWGSWSIWRFGVQNSLITSIDGEKHTLLNWNVFVDYNAKSPLSYNKFSNLYSLVQFTPTKNLSFFMESQTPTISGGDDFSQYNVGISYQPCAALETRLTYRSVKDHPIQRDCEQISLYANLRINEKYTVAGRWHFDVEHNRIPIQQYCIYRKSGMWYTGATLFFRDNGGKKETGFALSISLGETGTTLPVDVL